MTEVLERVGTPAVYIKTYGCQMNERDSESIAALLVRHGYNLVETETDADVIIVNTCSVRGKAEDKAVGKLGLMMVQKRERSGLIIGAVGCMAQRMGADILGKVKGLDFAVGPRRLHVLPAVIDAVRAGKGPVVDTGGEGEEVGEMLTDHVGEQVSAFVNILLGCDRHCAYCIVPMVRGGNGAVPGKVYCGRCGRWRRVG